MQGPESQKCCDGNWQYELLNLSLQSLSLSLYLSLSLSIHTGHCQNQSQISTLTGCLYPQLGHPFCDFAPFEPPHEQMCRQPVNIHVRPCQKDTKKQPKEPPRSSREPSRHLKALPKYHRHHGNTSSKPRLGNSPQQKHRL